MFEHPPVDRGDQRGREFLPGAGHGQRVSRIRDSARPRDPGLFAARHQRTVLRLRLSDDRRLLRQLLHHAEVVLLGRDELRSRDELSVHELLQFDQFLLDHLDQLFGLLGRLLRSLQLRVEGCLALLLNPRLRRRQPLVLRFQHREPGRGVLDRDLEIPVPQSHQRISGLHLLVRRGDQLDDAAHRGSAVDFDRAGAARGDHAFSLDDMGQPTENPPGDAQRDQKRRDQQQHPGAASYDDQPLIKLLGGGQLGDGLLPCDLTDVLLTHGASV